MIKQARERIGIVSEGIIYLDNAGAGPLPIDTVEAVESYVTKWYKSGEPWIEGLEIIKRSKKLFSELINARYDEIAVFPGLTYGLNAVLSSLRIKKGSNIVATDLNFPTSVYTLHSMKRSGAISEVRVLRSINGAVSIEDFERSIDENTVAVVIDHVSWITGYKFDLKSIAKIAHEKGSLLIVDGFHAAGVIPVDVKYLDVDVYLTGTYKWLMSLHGAGFGYIKQELLDTLNPSYAGWFAVEDSPIHRLEIYGEKMFKVPYDLSDIRFSRTASRVEWGTPPLTIFAGVEASLNFLLRYNAPGSYETHTSHLIKRLDEGLRELGCKVLTPQSRAAIIVFETRDPYYVQDELMKSKIIVSARPGVVRVSPHFYNTVDEIELLLQRLGELRICGGKGSI